MSHIGNGPSIFYGNRTEMKEYLREHFQHQQELYPGIDYSEFNMNTDEYLYSEKEAKEFLRKQAEELRTNYMIAVEFKSFGSVRSWGEAHKEKFEQLSAICQQDFTDWSKAVQDEIDRLKKQAFITCPDCGSKLNSELFLYSMRHMPTSYKSNGVRCSKDGFDIEVGDSFYLWEISLEGLGGMRCPVCGKSHIGGKTYFTKLERIAKRHRQNVEKVYKLASKQKSRSAWMYETAFRIG